MTAEFPLAVHALLYLCHTDKLTTSAELADNICTNPARVRKVMTALHRAQLVDSQRGKGSGYHCKQGTCGMTLGSVLSALGEDAISMNWRSGDMDKKCLIATGMGQIMDDIYSQMNSRCADYLNEITIGELCKKIFENKDVAK